MSRTAPYQWICLRTIKPRTQLRTLATEPPTRSEPNSTATEHPPTSTADVKSYLQNQDTVFLKTTKSHLSHIASTARTIQHLCATLPNSASKIQLLPQVPPYTTTVFRRERNNPQPQIKTLLTHIEVLHSNLTDLEYTPYPSSTAPSKADKFKKKLSEWSEQEKIDQLEDLRDMEVSHAGRLMQSTKGLKGHVEALETLGKLKTKIGDSFRRVETIGVAEDESSAQGKKVVGFGTGVTDIRAESGEEGKVSNPFTKGSVMEKMEMGDIVKAKGTKATGETANLEETSKTTGDTTEEKGVAPTKVADAVDKPTPPARRSLAELQAQLKESLDKLSH